MKRLFVAIPVSEVITKEIKSLVSELSKTNADLKLVSLSNINLN